MVKSNPAEVIEAYRRRQERRFPFSIADAGKAFLVLIIFASSGYVLITGRPELPTLIELKTNTPTFTPSITPTPSQTATATLTPTETHTETPEPENQCDCPAPEILVVTATFGATDTPIPLPSATDTASALPTFTPTVILTTTATLSPTQTLTPLPSVTSTPTQIIYIVQTGDTLGDIALRFGVAVGAIQTLNNLDTTMIYAGQILQIPGP